MPIAITGANGFIGQALCQHLESKQITATGLCRTVLPAKAGLENSFVNLCEVSTPWAEPQLSEALNGCNTIVHLAGRAHQLAGEDPEKELELQLNAHLELSKIVARSAKKAAVKRIVFISSAKVLGESSGGGVFMHDSPPAPEDAYAKAKWQTEQWLQSFCHTEKIELVIIRPGLVYQKDAKGNLASLQKAIDLYLPLPLSSIRNRRDLVGLDNLLELIEVCIEHPKAANQTFLVSDNKPLSTPELIRLIAQSRNKKPMLIPLPISILNTFALLFGKTQMLEKITGNFAMDITHTCDTLGWQPRLTPAQILCGESK